MSDTPTPGSDAAVAIGCTCPVLDNGHGAGAMTVGDPFPGTVWWMSGDCPVHQPKEMHDETR